MRMTGLYNQKQTCIRIISFIVIILATGIFSSFKKNTVRQFHLRAGSDLVGTPYIVIKKSNYELIVYDDLGWYGTYPVVFGSKSLDDKMVEGDRKTPEGSYKILSKKPHPKWGKMLMLDYPTDVDMQKFNERKEKGLIPANAKIGGGIGIHGTWIREDMAIDQFQNWTNGCISLKRDDVDDLYNIIPVGTKVTIEH